MYENKFFRFRLDYLIQVLITFGFMFFVLAAMARFVEVKILSAIGACALASSITTTFVAPGSKFTRAINVLAGYALGIFFGTLCYYANTKLQTLFPGIFTSTWLDVNFGVAIFGAFAVCCTLFSMAIFKLEHPPGAGFALGLVIEPWDHDTLIVVGTAIIILTILKRLIEPRLED